MSQGVLQGRILSLAMAGGVVVLVVVAQFVGPVSKLDDELVGTLRLVAIFLLFAAIVGSFIIRSVSRRQLARRLQATSPDEDSFPPELLRETVVSTALFEGVGMLGGFVYLMSHDPQWLGLSALAVIVVLLRLPSEERVRHAVETARETPL